MAKSYTYEGRQVINDPNAGLVEGAKVGPREELGEGWWYAGHGCWNYLYNLHNDGFTCGAICVMGKPCSPCRLAIIEALELCHGVNCSHK
jgi:hypothetical protein